MPGMYVVTSTAFVKRTRATLRKAELGFFGVCVYTRMQTPRFSGQPINAGDFVLVMTPSRPIRTSCENVGTVFPLRLRTQNKPANARKIRQLPHCAHKNPAREHTTLKGILRFRRPARNSARTPRGRTTLLASIRRGLLGFAGLASHSGRFLLPFRRAMFRE